MRDVITAVAGLGALVGFAVLVAVMLDRLTVSETEWSRAVFLFNGVEAVAFAAAGYFFGREVHRERAEKAEVQADKARAQADESRNQADQAKESAARLEGFVKGQREVLDRAREAFPDLFPK